MSPPSLRLCCRLPTVRERLAALVKHPLSDRTQALGRFIPARAGNTWPVPLLKLLSPVHPRPRGEHDFMSYHPSGSKPVGRIRRNDAAKPSRDEARAHLHLKETEWRYNHRHANKYTYLLQYLRKNPLS